VLSDVDSVRELLARGDGDDEEPRLSFVDWTPERDLLTTIADILNGIHATLIQVNDERGRRPDIGALPRPTTVIEKVEKQQIIALHQSIVAQFLPHKRTE
jgi:hypothetical protein